MTDPFRDPALDAMKGKTIAYLPISLGFDMAQAWGGVVKEEANHYGMKFISQDPNWSTDAMAQSLTNLIAQKPDVIVTQNPDLQSLARLLKQANAQGIYVIQVNMQGAVQTDAFVGPDLVGIGEQMGDIVVNSCGKNGKSKKIAIVQGVLTGGVSFFEVVGLKKVLAAHPDIQVVSSQAADWDASKARSITETVVQQNPAGRAKRQGDADHRRGRRAEHVRCPHRRNVRLRDQLQCRRHGSRHRHHHQDGVAGKAQGRFDQVHGVLAIPDHDQGGRQAGHLLESGHLREDTEVIALMRRGHVPRRRLLQGRIFTSPLFHWSHFT
jgi:hypothetical protein